MISRVEWLKECEKLLNCQKFNCGKVDIKCQEYMYNSKYNSIELLGLAAEIFNAQVMANGRLEDDGK